MRKVDYKPCIPLAISLYVYMSYKHYSTMDTLVVDTPSTAARGEQASFLLLLGRGGLCGLRSWCGGRRSGGGRSSGSGLGLRSRGSSRSRLSGRSGDGLLALGDLVTWSLSMPLHIFSFDSPCSFSPWVTFSGTALAESVVAAAPRTGASVAVAVAWDRRLRVSPSFSSGCVLPDQGPRSEGKGKSGWRVA